MAKKEANDNQAFVDVLNSCVEACSTMDFSDDGWKPTPGTYDVIITDIATGTKTNDKGITNAWLKPVFQIIGPSEYEGRSFSEFMYFSPQASELTPALRQLLRLATCISGTETRDPVAAAGIVAGAQNECLSLEVYQTEGKRGKSKGRIFTNIRFQSRLDSTEVTPEEAAAATA